MSGLSVPTMARHERGRIAAIASFRRHAAALDIRAEIRLIGRSADLPRLADEEHAAVVSVVAGVLSESGWTNRPEASFSEWGERGRMDLFAFTEGRLAVVEAKTAIGDMQDLHGALDVKARLAPAVARHLGWSVAPVTVILALAATDRNRKLVAAHASLFAGFTIISLPSLGRCLRDGRGAKGDRLLVWVSPRPGRPSWLAGRRRVRRELLVRSSRP